MANRRGGRTAALCGGAALVLAVGIGAAGAGDPPAAIDQSSSVVPAPHGDGALPVQPAGGGACIVGLNCGCIPHRTCPTPHARPGTAGANQHSAPGPQNP